MTDDDKALVEIWLEPACTPYDERCWSQYPLEDCDELGCESKAVKYVRSDRIEALSAENERLREQLSGISGKLNVMREALIHTAGICNPASGFLKNATGVRKKHIENVCDIALAALGDTK